MTNNNFVSTLIMMKWIPIPGGFLFPPDVVLNGNSPHIIISGDNEVILMGFNKTIIAVNDGIEIMHNAPSSTVTNQQALDKIMEMDW